MKTERNKSKKVKKKCILIRQILLSVITFIYVMCLSNGTYFNSINVYISMRLFIRSFINCALSSHDLCCSINHGNTANQHQEEI